MTLLEQFARTVLATKGVVLPTNSLAHVPVDGSRLDVALSNGIASLAKQNPISEAAFNLGRPFLDGYLVSQVGPVKVQELETKVRGLLK